MKSLVHIYTGDGKGKTTAAIGLGVRACGRGLKVVMVQFLKGTDTGEIYALKKLEPGFRLFRGHETKKFTWEMNQDLFEKSKKEQEELFDFANNELKNANCDLLILDEIIGAIKSGMIDLNNVVRFVKDKPDNVEIVLTGRNAPSELIDLADYVSEIKEIKHPMKNGIPPRKGIES